MERRELRLAGVAAAAVALSALWLASAFVDGVPFPPTALAERLVRLAPGDVATFFIDLLAHWAMRLLTIGVLAGALWTGAEALARTARRSQARPFVAAAPLAVAAFAASLASPASDPEPVRVAVAALAAAGLYGLIGTAATRTPAPPTAVEPTRRHMLQLGVGAALGVALVGGALGWLARRFSGPDTDVPVAAPEEPALIPPGRDFPTIPGLSPEVTSAADHYVVDIDLVSPSVDAGSWSLSVNGEVERPLELTFAGLQREFEVVEDFSVLTCVSNEVGGSLVGNSRWGGVRLADVLQAAGVRDGAVDVVFRAADGYSDSIPLDAARAPGTILATSQNGAPLTQDHGFPCRVRVPAIYGMKNVKWLESIEVVGSDYDGYWQKRGWSDEAMVKTQSRIDVAGDERRARVGEPAWIAGVAWAGDRGVARVEVSVDGGETWREAMLRAPISPLSWRQWAVRWTPDAEGEVEVMCRATDGEGATQTATVADPHPDGAAGYHSVLVDVS